MGTWPETIEAHAIEALRVSKQRVLINLTIEE
jgi:hypothetical protein